MNNKHKLIRIARLLIDETLSQEQKLEQIKSICLKVHYSKKHEDTYRINKYTLDEITEQICNHSCKTIEQILKAGNNECIWRNLVFYKAIKYTKIPCTEIASYFNLKSHFKVIRSVGWVENKLQTDAIFRIRHYQFLEV